jgi:type VII secretion protein EccB
MQSRRDQVHAYSYQVSRLTSALVEADPDSLEPPTRRVSRGIRGGVAVASLIAAVVFGVALFTPPSNAVLRQAGTLFVQKDTGGRYLVRDGVLHPVRNMTSARLILGPRMTTTTVSAKAVASLPHGEPIGVAGWPDDLSPAVLLNRGVWRTCSVGAASPSDADAPVLSTVVGAPPLTTRLGGDALLVAEPSRDGGSTLHLLWRGRRLRLADSAVRDALGYAAVEPAPVTSDWLALIPEGPVLMAPQVAGRGEPGPALGDTATVVGDIVEVRTGTGEVSHLLVTREGLAALNRTQYLLASTQSGPALELGVDGLAGTARTTLRLDAALPTTPPAVPQDIGSRVPCADVSLSGRAGSASVVTEPRPISTPRQRQLTAASGGGALVGLLDAREQVSQVFLVDGSAQAYPIADTQALTALGYDQRQVVTVPPAFLALLPQGPSIRRIDVEGV